MRSMAPLVSIILPTFNRAHFLEQAFRSLASQTYQVFEIIIVDDGSTDNTASVLKSKDVKYVSHERNRGKGRAIRTGIRYAVQKGFDYVLTIDTNDFNIFTDSEKLKHIYTQISAMLND